MRRKSRAVTLLVAVVCVVGLLPGTAPAASRVPSRASAACLVSVGSVTAGGDHRSQYFLATVPPTATPSRLVANDVYPDGQVRLSSSLSNQDVDGTFLAVSGFVVLGDALYFSAYLARDGEVVQPTLNRIGAGWGTFKALEVSYGPPQRSTAYGLRGDGVLFRWTIVDGAWRAKASYPGFAAVKSMTLISQTSTYDTFLANTRGGALYTIRIPTTSPMQPVVKLVRRSTWQVFEMMVPQKCGQYGTLLLGIDKDTATGYLYAVGHANGLATVIQSRGKVPAALADPIYFRWNNPDHYLFGE